MLVLSRFLIAMILHPVFIGVRLRSLKPPCRHYVRLRKIRLLRETVQRRTEQSECVSSPSPSPSPRPMCNVLSYSALLAPRHHHHPPFHSPSPSAPARLRSYPVHFSRSPSPLLPSFEFIHRIAPLLHCSRFLIKQHPLSPTLEQRWLRTVE
ncbi:hypothetical protein F5888DRAFT_259740 [Russula emetica]|nr:hypothetical protein F5888DRAFT_259740 [Russula emetica]